MLVIDRLSKGFHTAGGYLPVLDDVSFKAGKYMADGTFSSTAVSRQVGAGLVLRKMAESGLAVFEPGPEETVTPGNIPFLRYNPIDAV
ncbi:MAG: hypothetical protein K9N10_07925 [Deltaproteobacteria bacterium]|nr:hypothetical protein [Deltaproteobacteria bacterium]